MFYHGSRNKSRLCTWKKIGQLHQSFNEKFGTKVDFAPDRKLADCTRTLPKNPLYVRVRACAEKADQLQRSRGGLGSRLHGKPARDISGSALPYHRGDKPGGRQPREASKTEAEDSRYGSDPFRTVAQIRQTSNAKAVESTNKKVCKIVHFERRKQKTVCQLLFRLTGPEHLAQVWFGF